MRFIKNLRERLQARRDRLNIKDGKTPSEKGGIFFWYCLMSLIIQILWLIHNKTEK